MTWFALSGACGLSYQVAWTRMWSIGLGHEVPAILAVVAAFFGGLGAGAWILDRPISLSRSPRLWYVGIEVVLGVWALATIWLIPWANEATAEWIGATPSPWQHWSIAFGVPFVVLLPATAAMGATLPAMDRLFARWIAEGQNVGGLYGVNTLGAMVGAVASAFVLIPTLGVSTTVAVLAGCNFLCALGVGLAAGGEPGEASVARSAESGDGPERRGLRVTLFVTGMLGIGYEMLGVRVIGQVLENTVYSFACALAMFLLGTGIGGGLYQRRLRAGEFERTLTRLLWTTALFCVVGVVVMANAASVYRMVVPDGGSSFGVAIAGELWLAGAVFLLPATGMGATFSHLAQAARRRDGGVGVALAVNTAGAAVAPFVFVVGLLPVVGAKLALIGIAMGYGVIVPRRTWAWVPPLLAGLLFVVLPGDLRMVSPLPGGEVVAYRDGVMASVAVVSDAEGTRYLKVNDRFRMGGGGNVFAAARSGHLPLLLHPEPRSALFLGLGAGATFGAAAAHRGLRADCAELLPEVVELRGHFVPFEESVDDARRVFAADARRFVRACEDSYDVIVADLFHPARDGSGSLYTEEHFRAVRERLRPGGVFCQWLPMYQLEPDTLRVVVRTFLAVFADAHAYLSDFNTEHPVLGLVGWRDTGRYRSDWFERRVRDPGLRRELERLGLRNGYQVLGCFLGDAGALRSFAGEGPLNSDDRPIITYAAPEHVYRQSTPGPANLRDLLETIRPEPSTLVDPAALGAERFAERLARYWAARDHFLIGSLPGEDRIGRYLASAETSTDFATSYHVLLEIASGLAPSDLQSARSILQVLVRAHPHRPEARELLGRLRD